MRQLKKILTLLFSSELDELRMDNEDLRQKISELKADLAICEKRRKA